MSSNDQQSGSNPVPADHAGGAANGALDGAANAAAVDLQSIARRRAIVKGLSKGAALAGAAVPLQTLAVSGQRMKLKKTDGKWYQCSVSGNTSVMVSQNPAALTQCGAQAPGYYTSIGAVDITLTSNWPTWPQKSVNGVARAVCYGTLSGTTAFQPTARFSEVFGWQGAGNRRIGGYIKNYPTSDEAQWVTAALNATKFETSFPFSVSDVVRMSQLPPDRKAAALAFFKDWLNRPPL